MLIVSMLRMLGGGTAAVCANAAGQPASAKDNPATEQNHFFMSAHLPGGQKTNCGGRKNRNLRIPQSLGYTKVRGRFSGRSRTHVPTFGPGRACLLMKSQHAQESPYR